MNDLFKYITNKVAPFANDIFCRYKDQSATVLLAGVLMSLQELLKTATFGANQFSIESFTLTSDPQKILERDINGRVRKISVWVDSASGGPTPTIRVGTGATSANGGGVRVSAGQVNEIGEVAPNVELWAAANTSINAYVITRS